MERINLMDTPSISKQRKTGQITTIFLIQITSTTCFAVFYSGLSLFLTQRHGISKEIATLITGFFLSLHYFVPLIGGAIANNIISYKRLYIFGASLGILGCTILAFTNHIYLGFSFYLMNSLVNNVCLNMFATQLFRPDQVKERRVAFLWKYVAMNLGFMIGTICVGCSTISNDYFYLFSLMSIGLLTSVILALFFIHEPTLSENNLIRKSPLQQYTQIAFLSLFMVIFFLIFFNYVQILHESFTIGVLIVFTIIMCHEMIITKGEDNRKNLLKFIGFSISSIAFWMVYLLTPILLLQIIDKHVQKTIFNINLAPPWLLNIDSVLILTIIPLLTLNAHKKKGGRILSQQTSFYFIGSLLFAMISLLVFAYAVSSLTYHEKIPVIFILIYLAMLTLAEILIAPIGFALVGELIQEKRRGLMTGCWSMNMSVAGLFSSFFAHRYMLPSFAHSDITPQNISNIHRYIFSLCILLSLIILTLIMTSRKNVKLTTSLRRA